MGADVMDGIFRAAVAATNAAFADAAVDVSIEQWIGQGGRVDPKYAAAIIRKAIVSLRPHQHKRDDGQMVDVRATLSFIEVIPPNGADYRKEPVDPHDRFVITTADRTVTGPVVDVGEGTVDPTTLMPYAMTVYLG